MANQITGSGLHMKVYRKVVIVQWIMCITYLRVLLVAFFQLFILIFTVTHTPWCKFVDKFFSFLQFLYSSSIFLLCFFMQLHQVFLSDFFLPYHSQDIPSYIHTDQNILLTISNVTDVFSSLLYSCGNQTFLNRTCVPMTKRKISGWTKHSYKYSPINFRKTFSIVRAFIVNSAFLLNTNNQVAV